jgi:HEAT repeat protein
MNSLSTSEQLIAMPWAGNRLIMENLIGEFQNSFGDKLMENILSYVSDANAGVRAGAARTLGFVGTEQAIQPLIGLLNDTDIHVSVHAAHALGQIGEPAVNALISVFRTSSDRLTQWHAVSALGQSDDPRVVDIFLEALCIKDDLIRKYAIYGLAKFKDKRAVELLINLVTSHDGNRNEVADAAAGILAEIGDERAIRPIFRAMVAEIIWVPEALAKFGEPAIKLLMSGLNAKSRRTPNIFSPK